MLKAYLHSKLMFSKPYILKADLYSKMEFSKPYIWFTEYMVYRTLLDITGYYWILLDTIVYYSILLKGHALAEKAGASHPCFY